MIYNNKINLLQNLLLIKFYFKRWSEEQSSYANENLSLNEFVVLKVLLVWVLQNSRV